MWDALCDLVPFAQFQKVEKHPRWSVTVNNVAGLPWVFFTFSKVCKLYHIAQSVSYESRGFHALSHTNSKSNQTRPNSIFNPSRPYPGRRKNNPKFLFSHFCDASKSFMTVLKVINVVLVFLSLSLNMFDTFL